ncbi:hypothetical protein BVX98_05720, partial [bacterium F11]
SGGVDPIQIPTAPKDFVDLDGTLYFSGGNGIDNPFFYQDVEDSSQKFTFQRDHKPQSKPIRFKGDIYLLEWGVSSIDRHMGYVTFSKVNPLTNLVETIDLGMEDRHGIFIRNPILEYSLVKGNDKLYFATQNQHGTNIVSFDGQEFEHVLHIPEDEFLTSNKLKHMVFREGILYCVINLYNSNTPSLVQIRVEGGDPEFKIDAVNEIASVSDLYLVYVKTLTATKQGLAFFGETELGKAFPIRLNFQGAALSSGAEMPKVEVTPITKKMKPTRATTYSPPSEHEGVLYTTDDDDSTIPSWHKITGDGLEDGGELITQHPLNYDSLKNPLFHNGLLFVMTHDESQASSIFPTNIEYLKRLPNGNFENKGTIPIRLPTQRLHEIGDRVFGQVGLSASPQGGSQTVWFDVSDSQHHFSTPEGSSDPSNPIYYKGEYYVQFTQNEIRYIGRTKNSFGEMTPLDPHELKPDRDNLTTTDNHQIQMFIENSLVQGGEYLYVVAILENVGIALLQFDGDQFEEVCLLRCELHRGEGFVMPTHMQYKDGVLYGLYKESYGPSGQTELIMNPYLVQVRVDGIPSVVAHPLDFTDVETESLAPFGEGFAFYGHKGEERWAMQVTLTRPAAGLRQLREGPEVGTLAIQEKPIMEAIKQFLHANATFFNENADALQRFFHRLQYAKDYGVSLENPDHLRILALMPAGLEDRINRETFDVLAEFVAGHRHLQRDGPQEFNALAPFFEVVEMAVPYLQNSQSQNCNDFLSRLVYLHRKLEANAQQLTDFFRQMRHEGEGARILSQTQPLEDNATPIQSLLLYARYLRGETEAILTVREEERLGLQYEAEESFEDRVSWVAHNKAYEKPKNKRKGEKDFEDITRISEWVEAVAPFKDKDLKDKARSLATDILSQAHPGQYEATNQLTQNAVDAHRERYKKVSPSKRPPVEWEVFVRERRNENGELERELVCRLRDHGNGMNLGRILGPLWAKRAKPKANDPLFGGEFGHGFNTTYLEDYDHLWIKTDDGKKAILAHMVPAKEPTRTISANTNRPGTTVHLPEIVGLAQSRSEGAHGTTEGFHGTTVEWTKTLGKDDPLPVLEAMLVQQAIQRNVGGIEDNKVLLNETSVNEKFDVQVTVNLGKLKEGKEDAYLKLSLSPHSFEKSALVNGHREESLPEWLCALLDDKVQEFALGRGVYAELHGMPRAQGEGFSHFEKYRRPFQRAMFVAVLRAMVLLYFTRGKEWRPPPISKEFFKRDDIGADTKAKDVDWEQYEEGVIDRCVYDDAVAINKGKWQDIQFEAYIPRTSEPEEIQELKNRNKEFLMSLIEVHTKDTGKMSLWEMRRRLKEEAANQAKKRRIHPPSFKGTPALRDTLRDAHKDNVDQAIRRLIVAMSIPPSFLERFSSFALLSDFYEMMMNPDLSQEKGSSDWMMDRTTSRRFPLDFYSLPGGKKYLEYNRKSEEIEINLHDGFRVMDELIDLLSLDLSDPQNLAPVHKFFSRHLNLVHEAMVHSRERKSESTGHDIDIQKDPHAHPVPWLSEEQRRRTIAGSYGARMLKSTADYLRLGGDQGSWVTIAQSLQNRYLQDGDIEKLKDDRRRLAIAVKEMEPVVEDIVVEGFGQTRRYDEEDRNGLDFDPYKQWTGFGDPEEEDDEGEDNGDDNEGGDEDEYPDSLLFSVMIHVLGLSPSFAINLIGWLWVFHESTLLFLGQSAWGIGVMSVAIVLLSLVHNITDNWDNSAFMTHGFFKHLAFFSIYPITFWFFEGNIYAYLIPLCLQLMRDTRLIWGKNWKWGQVFRLKEQLSYWLGTLSRPFPKLDPIYVVYFVVIGVPLLFGAEGAQGVHAAFLVPFPLHLFFWPDEDASPPGPGRPIVNRPWVGEDLRARGGGPRQTTLDEWIDYWRLVYPGIRSPWSLRLLQERYSVSSRIISRQMKAAGIPFNQSKTVDTILVDYLNDSPIQRFLPSVLLSDFGLPSEIKRTLLQETRKTEIIPNPFAEKRRALSEQFLRDGDPNISILLRAIINAHVVSLDQPQGESPSDPSDDETLLMEMVCADTDFSLWHLTKQDWANVILEGQFDQHEDRAELLRLVFEIFDNETDLGDPVAPPTHDNSRESSGIMASDFWQMSDSALDPADGWNINLIEKILDRATEMISQPKGPRIHATIVGGTRYLRSSNRKDIDIALWQERLGLPLQADQELLKAMNKLLASSPNCRIDEASSHLIINDGKGERSIKLNIMMRMSGSRFPERLGEVVATIHSRFNSDDIDKQMEAYLAGVYYFEDDDALFKEEREIIENGIRPSLFWDAVRTDRMSSYLQIDFDDKIRGYVAKRLNESAHPFDPSTLSLPKTPPDHSWLIYEARKTLWMLNHNTLDFKLNNRLRPLISDLLGQSRIHFADNLPGSFRIQKVEREGRVEFHILVDRSLRWLIDRNGTYWNNLSRNQQQSITTFFASKLLHEAAELLMESEKEVDWSNDLDPELPHTEAAAVRAELRFLSQIEGFWRDFRPLINENSNSPLFELYQNTLGKLEETDSLERLIVTTGPNLEDWVDQQGEAIEHFLRRINVLDGSLDWARVKELENHMASEDRSLAELERDTALTTDGRNSDASQAQGFPTDLAQAMEFINSVLLDTTKKSWTQTEWDWALRLVQTHQTNLPPDLTQNVMNQALKMAKESIGVLTDIKLIQPEELADDPDLKPVIDLATSIILIETERWRANKTTAHDTHNNQAIWRVDVPPGSEERSFLALVSHRGKLIVMHGAHHDEPFTIFFSLVQTQLIEPEIKKKISPKVSGFIELNIIGPFYSDKPGVVSEDMRILYQSFRNHGLTHSVGVHSNSHPVLKALQQPHGGKPSPFPIGKFLAIAILADAIEDYIRLRDLGVRTRTMASLWT